ncbi:MAG: hypothetical protein AWU55_213 [Halomonadaceae bacterium T82-2]|nr:MAG: hypothetical protein AWU55_213 [Halomonadaceae bacterium T82-2]
MSIRRQTGTASLIVILTGALWGLYWIPVRRLDALLPGAWGSLLIVALATLLLSPFAVIHRRRLRAADPWSLAAIALGGAAFVMYSIGLVHGRVATVILLFYLTPVWSTLIARLWLRWPTPWPRYAAIAVGFAGLALVLGDNGTLPLPRGVGDWLGLASGLLWALSSTGIRLRGETTGAMEGNFIFCAGATLTAAALAPWLSPWPALPSSPEWPTLIGWSLAAGGLWWALSLSALLWAATRLEPARLGILLMSEVLVGVISAALFAGEPFGLQASLGALLVIAAALLELWPISRAGQDTRV